MRQAVVARSFCAGRSHGIASRRFLPGSRNAPLASLPRRFLPGSRKTPLASLSQRLLLGSRHAPCRASGETLPIANAASALEQGLAKPLLCKALGGNRSSTRKPEQSVREPERSVQETGQSDEEPRVRVGEPLPSDPEDRPHLNRKTSAPESEDIRTRIGRHPHQNRKTSAPESEDIRTRIGGHPRLIAKTPTWRTSKPQFSSRICILGVAGLPYNL